VTRGRVDDALLSDRVHRFLDRRLPDAALVAFHPARLERWDCDEPVPAVDAMAAAFQPTSAGTAWGAPWSTMWLRVTGAAPVAPPGCRVELEVDLGFRPGMPGFQSEGLAYDGEGRVLKAINPSTRWLPLAEGEGYEIFIEAAANPTILIQDSHDVVFTPTPLGDPQTAGDAPFYTLGAVGAAVRHIETERLAMELEVLTGMAWALEESSARRAEVLAAVDHALDVLDTNDLRGTAPAARAVLAPLLMASAGGAGHDVTAVGHAHIDSAWLWPFRETRRKVARTVANVLHRMDEDPELVYAMSSAQQYAWLQADHPGLFERVRERVAEGRFLPVGGMWVESDVVMPAGESLVRQLLVGSGYFEREFGVSTTLGWLPDSFGYSGALPQLLRSAGAHRFVTQKMSWNTVNRFPHHTFAWEGIDGSRVVTHFPSVDTYNSALTGAELAYSARNLSDPTLYDGAIAPFGYGDGGGGPTREMAERARLTHDLEGSPRVTVASPERFFDALDEAVSAGAALPVWFGEMYLESCRGVATSQARTKEAHRRVERLLREAELWWASAAVRRGASYPYEELDEAWRELLLMEFHDVLPGSSIAWVHREAVERLDRVAADVETLIAGALAVLAGDGRSELIANASPFPTAGVPGHGLARAVVPAEAVDAARVGDRIRLVNVALEVEVDARDGAVVSIVERATGRQLLMAGGHLHLPTLHRDVPVRWDAWDVDSSIDAVVEVLDAAESVDLESDLEGASRVVVRRRFGDSSMQQTIELRPGESQLRLETRVDWQERERLLKLEFPLAPSTDRWQAETQFGYVERPTHRNTSWDEARFEATAHRWVRVAEPGFGIALVNERTYGYDAVRVPAPDGSGTRIRASLLRSSRFPDPDADRGSHVFRFAVLPAPDVGDAVRAAYGFTDAKRRVTGDAVAPLLTSSHEGVVVDTVKLAEDRSGDVIVRLYESRGARTTMTLKTGFSVSAVSETDILERPLPGGAEALDRLEFAAFRVRTLRLTPG
jgi:alpha-mannosidase